MLLIYFLKLFVVDGFSVLSIEYVCFVVFEDVTNKALSL